MAVPLPPLNLKTDQRADSGADSGLSMNGTSWGIGTGDWVVNVPTSSGPGLSLMGGAGSGVSLWVLAGAAALTAFVLLRKKGQ